MKYVLETGNPKESAGKDRMTFSLRIKALKKPDPVKIDLLVTNGLRSEFHSLHLSKCHLDILSVIYSFTRNLVTYSLYIYFKHQI